MLDPFTASDAFEDLRQLVLRDRDPDWPPPDDLAGRVPVEPLGAGVPARDHAIECRADDRVVRGLHDGSGEGQRCFGPAALPESVASGSTIVATVPMTVPIKACSRSDSLWVWAIRAGDAHTVPRVAIGRGTSRHEVKCDRLASLMSVHNCSPLGSMVLVRIAHLGIYTGALFCSTDS